jgi:hypothetical protein
MEYTQNCGIVKFKVLYSITIKVQLALYIISYVILIEGSKLFYTNDKIIDKKFIYDNL